MFFVYLQTNDKISDMSKNLVSLIKRNMNHTHTKTVIYLDCKSSSYLISFITASQFEKLYVLTLKIYIYFFLPSVPREGNCFWQGSHNFEIPGVKMHSS